MSIKKGKMLLSYFIIFSSTLIPLALAESVDKEFFKKINESYYNYPRLGIHQFSCEVKANRMENLKKNLALDPSGNAKKIKALNLLKFFFQFDGGKFRFYSSGYRPTGDSQFDDFIQSSIEANRNMVEGTFTIVSDFVVTPIVDFEKWDFEKKEISGGYEVGFAQNDFRLRMDIDKDLKVTALNIDQAGKETVTKQEFEKTEKGYLVNRIENVSSSSLYELIQYQNIQGFQLPRTMTVSKMIGGTDDVIFSFFDYKIRK